MNSKIFTVYVLGQFSFMLEFCNVLEQAMVNIVDYRNFRSDSFISITPELRNC